VRGKRAPARAQGPIGRLRPYACLGSRTRYQGRALFDHEYDCDRTVLTDGLPADPVNVVIKSKTARAPDRVSRRPGSADDMV